VKTVEIRIVWISQSLELFLNSVYRLYCNKFEQIIIVP
jgi:hypothetical protein